MEDVARIITVALGGNCVLNPDYGPYRPDPYWTPCDYSLGPQYPEGCGN
jgi:hypothetical protein